MENHTNKWEGWKRVARRVWLRATRGGAAGVRLCQVLCLTLISQPRQFSAILKRKAERKPARCIKQGRGILPGEQPGAWRAEQSKQKEKKIWSSQLAPQLGETHDELRWALYIIIIYIKPGVIGTYHLHLAKKQKKKSCIAAASVYSYATKARYINNWLC